MRAKLILPAAISVFLGFSLMGCAVKDQRRTDDEQSCRSMGHLPGTPVFTGCMADLNQRRCVEGHMKNGQTRHVAATACTKLN